MTTATTAARSVQRARSVQQVRPAQQVRPELIEHEDFYDDQLSLLGARDSQPGEISGFVPPGDIHRIRNISTSTAISLHICGTDVTWVASSARRYYN